MLARIEMGLLIISAMELKGILEVSMLSMLIVISISYPGFRSILLDLVWKTRRASGVGEDGSLH